jgi:hypothetical protein
LDEGDNEEDDDVEVYFKNNYIIFIAKLIIINIQNRIMIQMKNLMALINKLILIRMMIKITKMVRKIIQVI